MVAAVHPRLCTIDPEPAAGTTVLRLFDQLTDPRKARGRRHSLTTILIIAINCTLLGFHSWATFGQWSQQASDQQLAAIGAASRPETCCFRRVLSRLDAELLDAVCGAWVWLRCTVIKGRTVVSFDGKTMRAAKKAGGQACHLISAMIHHTGTVTAQIAVDDKTNEIPRLRDLLKKMVLTPVVIVADALHTQTETAQQILSQHGDYLFTVKDNHPTMKAELKRLPWRKITSRDATHETEERTRGRHVIRKIQVFQYPDFAPPFPGARQVAKLTRIVTEKAQPPPKSSTSSARSDPTRPAQKPCSPGAKTTGG